MSFLEFIRYIAVYIIGTFMLTLIAKFISKEIRETGKKWLVIPAIICIIIEIMVMVSLFVLSFQYWRQFI